MYTKQKNEEHKIAGPVTRTVMAVTMLLTSISAAKAELVYDQREAGNAHIAAASADPGFAGAGAANDEQQFRGMAAAVRGRIAALTAALSSVTLKNTHGD